MKGFDFIKNVENIKNDIENILNKGPYYKKEKKDEIIKNLQDHFPTWSTNDIYNRECPDIYAGDVNNGVIKEWISKEERMKKIKVKNGRHIQSYDFSKLEPDTKRNSIVIILESPHKNEYELDQLWDKPNPAVSATGTKLGNNINDLIGAVSKSYPQINSGKYQIVLMNSIQYQCSLGVTPLNVTVRDLVFSKIWKLNEIRESFVTRLESYNPQFIFNLCTMGEVVPHLDFLVQALINDKYLRDDKVNLFVGNHPSGWRKGNKFVYDVREPYKDIIKF